MTELQMKKTLKRIWFYISALQRALNEAHHKDLIVYKNYQDESPCASLYHLKDRLKNTTKNQIAEIVHDQIKKELW